ncbi:hypothetical protein [Paucibacter soli]|uniref:hypothetical protein n=1 Tax=Paucibacter soli TaxID=3133433 RepID=UPI0030AEFF59
MAHIPGSTVKNDYRLAENYAANSGFLKHAGRHVELCAYDDGEGGVDPECELRVALARMRDAGHESAVVKLRETKAGIGIIALKGKTDLQIHDELYEKFDWALVAHAGKMGAFIVQSHVVMEHEYRMVVVSGYLVGGAGCIEEFTPLDNGGFHFDTRTRRSRGSFGSKCSVIDSHPEIVKQYLKASPQIIKDLREAEYGTGADVPHGPETFVLDLCLVNGNVAVVEVNPARNFGLYAMNYQGIMVAMRWVANRHIHGDGPTQIVTSPKPYSTAKKMRP